MLPSAKLIDMYVSDEIDRIFDKVREESLTRQKSFGVDSSQISLPEKSNSAPKMAQGPADGQPSRKPAQGRSAAEPAVRADQGRRDSHKTAYFVAGGAAIVALGVTSYIMLGDSPKKTEKTYDIP
jgi:hypothetical protein